MEARQSLDLSPGDAVDFYTEGEPIILRKARPSCVIHDTTENLPIEN